MTEDVPMYSTVLYEYEYGVLRYQSRIDSIGEMTRTAHTVLLQ